MTTSIAARRTALAAAFGAILIGVLCISSELHSVAAVAAFATAVSVIGVAVIGWERVIASAESTGLVAARENVPHF